MVEKIPDTKFLFQATAFSGNQDLLDKLILLANNETYPKYEDYLLVCEGRTNTKMLLTYNMFLCVSTNSSTICYKIKVY